MGDTKVLEERRQTTIPLAVLENAVMEDEYSGRLLNTSKENLEIAAEILNVIGKHGCSINDAGNVLRLCEAVAQGCTTIGVDYHF